MENLKLHYPGLTKLVHKNEFHITNDLGQLIATLPSYDDIKFSEKYGKKLVDSYNKHDKLIQDNLLLTETLKELLRFKSAMLLSSENLQYANNFISAINNAESVLNKIREEKDFTPVHRCYSDSVKLQMLELPTYKFRPVKYDLNNDHDFSIMEALENNPICGTAEVFFWNKKGSSLYFKILNPLSNVQKVIKEIEKILFVKFTITELVR